MRIAWHLSGAEIEAESFRCIETEMPKHDFSPAEWRVARRLIHASADFGLAESLAFAHDPIAAGHEALRERAPIYCDANMIRSGISVPRLRRFNPDWSRDDIHCYIADEDIARRAAENGTTRALAAVEKGRKVIDGGIVLIGNAPLALAGICRLTAARELRPRLIIGMPVGFVNVVESKELLRRLDIPQIVVTGRRGGSPLAVAALHGLMESAPECA
ncbi:MAG: precorrin-8X methylmutase [Deltaproteobacteria bacterium]|nr:precorrin-8X methylmutase [Candidatus Anaeroferrophillacea bacterium]